MSVGPEGASRRGRALEIFDRVPELEIWTYGPRPIATTLSEKSYSPNC